MEDIPTILLGSVERAPWGWGLFGMVLVALIKTWPIINAQLISVKDRIQDRKERKESEALTGKTADLDDCKIRLDAMDLRLTASEERAHNFEMKLMGALTSYNILEVEVEITNPDSPALKQARRVMQGVFRIVGDTPTDMTASVAGMN